MRAPRLFALWCLLTGITAGLASAAPPSFITVPEKAGASRSASFTFQVETPALLLKSRPDGSTEVRLGGFAGRQTRPGVPDLPYSVVRVAIPFGVTPRLTIAQITEDRVRGAIPHPVARVSAALDAEGKEVVRTPVLAADPAFFGGTESFPKEIASLGVVGSFRDQRYVDVVISPVRFDPKARGLRVARSLSVTVTFDGDTGARSAPAPDPRLEDLYRDMFVNYEQGTLFRAQPSSSTLAGPAAPLTGPRVRIRIRANGMVRLDFARLNGTGFESQPLSSYALTDRGVEVPLLVFDANGNDQLEAGDWIQFYGQALDDEPKTVLNTPIPDGTSIYELRDFTDENVYLLTAALGAHARLSSRSAPPNLSPPATKFDAIAHLEVDNAFRPLGENDPWYWGPAIVAGGSRDLSVPLPALASGTDPVRVIARLRGLTEDSATPSDHKSRITVFNSLSQILLVNNDDGSFDGRNIYNHDFLWTYSGGPVLSSPVQLTIAALSVAGTSGYSNQFMPDFVEIRYKRTFQASGDALTFDFPDGDAELQVTGLLNAPEVWEITGRVGGTGVVAPVRVTGGTLSGGAGNFSIRFHMTQDPAMPDGTPRRFVVAGSGAVSIPANPDFTPDVVSDLRDTSNQADLIVIASPVALGIDATPTLNTLLSWKLANQGITSKIVKIQDVYDEFGDGLSSPQAIKAFLAFTLSTNSGEGWSGRKPAWVLLIGDGSFDPKYNDTTVAPSNFLPTQILFKDDPLFGYYASDSILADVAGSDTIPDLVVGRIPTRTDAQTNLVLQKIYDYQQNPPLGNWRRHAVFIADRGKAYGEGEAQEWMNTNAIGRAWMKIPPHTARTLNYWTDYCGSHQNGCNPDLLRSDIKKAVNGTDGVSDGASILQYTGHGNFNVWSDDAFFAQGWNGYFDVNALVNGVKLPWVIVHNCLSGGFENNFDMTLGEDWLKRSGGGAMAVFAPSGLTDGYWGDDATNQIWRRLFGPNKERVLGVAVADATNFICGHDGQQACQNYVLLGDPTTRLVFPTVGPASQVSAVAGNSQVALTWTASSTSGAKYDVYRAATSPDSAYTRIAQSLVSPSYLDASALNTKVYFYYVVALDAEGFESRWSNFNSDCGVSGPDCVTARPLNPNPPAIPTGLTVSDPETGGKLLLSWSANGEPDLDHYTVSWGTNPGQYTSFGNAAKLTTFTISGLTDGTTYYIALTATNTSGQTSGYSQEKLGIPTYVRGLRAPAFIGSLQISKSGTDAILTWTPVTTDIYGKPAVVTAYEVFRGTTPGFVPGPGNKIGQSVTATFPDPGALSPANPDYHYLVRAVSAGGIAGGLGNQLPNGIEDLIMTKTPDGLGGYTLGFSWSAVTTDFDGEPLAIDHYEIYSVNHAFSRADVKNGLVPLVGSPTSPSFSVTAPASSQYYSVLAVDARGNKSSF